MKQKHINIERDTFEVTIIGSYHKCTQLKGVNAVFCSKNLHEHVMLDSNGKNMTSCVLQEKQQQQIDYVENEPSPRYLHILNSNYLC